MNRSEFETSAQAAKTFYELSANQAWDGSSDFWTGYQRGLRRHYHGVKFGTDEEHKLWSSTADDHHDEGRRYLGLGYCAGFEGQNVQQAMKTLAGRQYMSEIGRLGGSSTSPKKSRSSAENGKLGGRPPKKRA